jgi:hypothetical protein
MPKRFYLSSTKFRDRHFSWGSEINAETQRPRGRNMHENDISHGHWRGDGGSTGSRAVGIIESLRKKYKDWVVGGCFDFLTCSSGRVKEIHETSSRSPGTARLLARSRGRIGPATQPRLLAHIAHCNRIVIGLHCAIDASQSLGCHSDLSAMLPLPDKSGSRGLGSSLHPHGPPT